MDAAKPNLGLTNWRGAVVRKPDVEQYLIFAQGQAMRRVPMHMADWIKKLDGQRPSRPPSRAR